MPLPPGMLACTLSAGALPLLVMVTEPAPPAPKDTDVAGMFSVVGVPVADTVTGTGVDAVLLPPKPMAVGPSAEGAVNVIVQLAEGARTAGQVVLDTVMPLPAGMLACTLSAFAPPLLVMVTDPVLPAANDSGVAGMLSVVVGAGAPVTGAAGGVAAALR